MAEIRDERLPSGTVTFLFTDIQGSTALWDADPQGMRAQVAVHEGHIRHAVQAHKGYVVKSLGDGFMAVFADAIDAVRAAVEAQLALSAIDRFRVRMGLHTGTAHESDGDYLGPAVNRAARIMAAAHGGQILLSDATAALTRDDIESHDLGVHSLRGIAHVIDFAETTAHDRDEIAAVVEATYDRRNWGQLVMQAGALVGWFARAGDPEGAAVVVAALEHEPAGVYGRFRSGIERLRPTFDALPNAVELRARGAAMTRDEMMAFALARLRPS